MTFGNSINFTSAGLFSKIWIQIAVAIICFGSVSAILAQSTVTQNSSDTITVEDAPEQEIITLSKNVIVRKSARGVLVFGGDIFIDGNVSGDVAAIGGSVIQKKNGRISGDVIVIGGTYIHEDNHPLRSEGRETLVYAGYEEELRALAKDPFLLLAPALSWSFLIQRVFSLFFWFVVGLLVTMISPGAVSRAVARTGIAPLSIVAIGAAGLVLLTVGVIAGVGIFPGFISGILGLMAFFVIILTYVFGRTVFQLIVGKWILRTLAPERKPSESIAILIGASFWTFVLSMPLVWVAALFVLFSAGIGMIVTAKRQSMWKTA